MSRLLVIRGHGCRSVILLAHAPVVRLTILSLSNEDGLPWLDSLDVLVCLRVLLHLSNVIAPQLSLRLTFPLLSRCLLGFLFLCVLSGLHSTIEGGRLEPELIIVLLL